MILANSLDVKGLAEEEEVMNNEIYSDVTEQIEGKELSIDDEIYTESFRESSEKFDENLPKPRKTSKKKEKVVK